jgi:hypothetical protein
MTLGRQVQPSTLSVQRLPAQTTQTGETLVEYTANSNMQLTTQVLKGMCWYSNIITSLNSLTSLRFLMPSRGIWSKA